MSALIAALNDTPLCSCTVAAALVVVVAVMLGALVALRWRAGR